MSQTPEQPQTPEQHAAVPGGIVHTYRKYEPQRFPMPDAAPPDLVSPAFEHLLMYGSTRGLTPEQLAEAVDLDPAQIAGLGPSIDALVAMLLERKRRILETYETDHARDAALTEFAAAVQKARPPDKLLKAFDRAVRAEQPADLERIWYRVSKRDPFANQVLRVRDRLIEKDEVDELADRYAFTGRTQMDVPQALAIKEELETIDRLLKQLEEARKNAKVYRIDMEALARFADEGELAGMEEIQQRVADLLRQMAEQQGMVENAGGVELTPRAYKIFQGKLLDEIFSDLQAAKSGRHHENISGDGAVETQRTKPYEFGDSLANMDVAGSMINAMIRDPGVLPVRMKPADIEIHRTRNTPKCATAVLMDMSGSMRWGGLYVHVKKMALALHGLIRGEYPGDFVDFVEICTLPKRRHIAEVPALLPRPVTLHDPLVRLRADMSDSRLNEFNVHPHFTNIQQALKLARLSLQVQDTPNRQIVLITDGLPTAHFEGQYLYMLYPPDPRTERETLREGLLCKEQGITINIFLLSTWAQDEDDIRFAHHLAESTQGRVFFVTGAQLERYVVWDYVKRRRQIIG
ncbi:MAG TPA: hypothetical protein P5572_09050 [Phycisphaerae bacterium]|nr:hypothetical protein [Phycisphaerales bacterium]HRX85152.1 hypothetical protein [Phycisphaerae bacterium]